MTIIIDGTQGGFTVTDDEPRVITATGTASGGTAINNSTGASTGAEIVVAGSAIGSTVGAELDGSDRMIITQSGSVLGVGDNGTDGIFSAGSGNRLTVAGYLFGADSALTMSSTSTNFLLTVGRTGIIEGGSNGDGADAGSYAAAIASRANNMSIVNRGEILGQFNPDNGRSVAIVQADEGNGPGGFDPAAALNGQIANAGFIGGDVFMSAGNDLFDQRGGGLTRGEISLGRDDDTFRGGLSDEIASGDGGADVMVAGGGNDTMLGGNGNDFINGDTGDDTLRGGNGNDVLVGAAGDDLVDGGAGSDNLRGSRGDDTIIGGTGNDILLGGADDDLLQGFAGTDTLNGGVGDDVLSGGGNFDRFVFVGDFGADIITDFNASNFEKIDLSAVLGVINPADLFANHLFQDGADVLFDDLRGNTIVIENFALANLDAGDFILN